MFSLVMNKRFTIWLMNLKVQYAYAHTGRGTSGDMDVLMDGLLFTSGNKHNLKLPCLLSFPLLHEARLSNHYQYFWHFSAGAHILFHIFMQHRVVQYELADWFNGKHCCFILLKLLFHPAYLRFNFPYLVANGHKCSLWLKIRNLQGLVLARTHTHRAMV